MAEIPHPQQNHILDALPQAERERLFPHLKLVALPLGSALYESGDMLRHILFPDRGPSRREASRGGSYKCDAIPMDRPFTATSWAERTPSTIVDLRRRLHASHREPFLLGKRFCANTDLSLTYSN